MQDWRGLFTLPERSTPSALIVTVLSASDLSVEAWARPPEPGRASAVTRPTASRAVRGFIARSWTHRGGRGIPREDGLPGVLRGASAGEALARRCQVAEVRRGPEPLAVPVGELVGPSQEGGETDRTHTLAMLV